MQTNDFESLYGECRDALERFVRYKLPSEADAEDVIQDVSLTAFRKFDTLRDKTLFKAWIISIARNRVNDYFHEKAKIMELPLDALSETRLAGGRCGIELTTVAGETLEKLGGRDKQILYLYYFRCLPQAEIARLLVIPEGTVKSRLHTAKTNFKAKYPRPSGPKGEKRMNKLPEIMPEYKITASDKPPFAVVWEELMGWFLIPREGEKLSWGMYDMPEGRLTESDEMAVVGRAEVHGIEGVEITVKTTEPMAFNSEGGGKRVTRTFVAQLTDTHCRYLAESHIKNGVKRIYTFLDGKAFTDNWGFGENNRGNETHLAPKGDIVREGSEIKSKSKAFLLDITGRYTVDIAGRSYDTVCVVDIETYNSGVVSEQYLDAEGRTVLWRRFNRDDWAFDIYKQRWSEKLPQNERLTVNGDTYVHWYDCITDYIL